MADPDFEPLHSGDEEDEFLQDRKKRDGGGKRQRTKSAQLFKRSGDKKERSSFESSRPITAPSPGKSIQRPVQGLVGPGDSQFGVSPPTSPPAEVGFEARLASSAPKAVQNNTKPHFTSNASVTSGQQNWTNSKEVDITKTQGQQVSVRRLPNQASPQPPQTVVFQKSMSQPGGGHQIQQQMILPAGVQTSLQQHQLPPIPKSSPAPPPPNTGPREDKLTLLAKAKLYQGPGNVPISPVQQTFVTMGDGSEQKSPSVTTPPRVASPVDGGPVFAQSPVFSPPVDQNPPPDRQAQWSSNESKSPRMHQKENWADFSKTFHHSVEDLEDSDDQQRQRSSSYSSAASTSSVDESDGEDTVWKITEEQRDYYVKQFKKLQPNAGGVIKGTMARDFFLKSGLPTETLSRIWHLSDLNKDHALDLEEFCIAMHLVVAIRHGVDLPQVLPSSLVPRIEGVSTSLLSTTANVGSSSEHLTSDEKIQSPGWANFDSATDTPDSEEGQTVTTPSSGWNAPSSSGTATDDSANFRGQPAAESPQMALPSNPKHAPLSHSFSVGHPSQRTQEKSPKLMNKKHSIEIARPRAMGGLVNLMDLGPGQLLPPPGGKKGRVPGKRVVQSQGMPPSVTSPTGPSLPEHPPASSQSDLSDNDVVKVRSKTEPSIEKVSDRSFSWESDTSTSREEAKELGVSQEELEKGPEVTNEEESKEQKDNEEVKLRRTSSRKSRPRSYTGDSRSSVELEHLTDHNPDLSGDLGHPPTPPPRAKKGHSRASSLDLNKLLGTKGGQLFDDKKETEEAVIRDLSPPKKPPRTSIYREHSPDRERSENETAVKPPPQEPATKAIVRARPEPAGGRKDNLNHRRSASLDWGKEHAATLPPPKAFDGNLPKLYPKRAAPNPPHLKNRAKSEERGLSPRSVTASEDNDQQKKGSQPVRPLERKMRKHELQARIRLLKEKNSSLSSINNELNQELREIMENRTTLELKTEKLRQSFNK